MRYISTRGQAPALSFEDTVMTGLAPDGGLFLPESIPDVRARLDDWRDLSFQEIFQAVATPFVGESVPGEDLRELIERAYAPFDHPEIVPVVPLGGLFLCELFHGPTFAFKDVALQFLGHLFEYFLARRDQRLTILGATSGDTGAAAIHALKGRKGVEVFILYPKGRVSPMQERQMTTVPDANIHCIAVEGSFDDAQALVKELFNDREFNEAHSLGAVNSINWARVMAQITYFFYAYFRVLDARENRRDAPEMSLGDPVQFAVPTGNFGHLYAGDMARRMGLPISRLILATNENAILSDWVDTGRYFKGQVRQTLSPSMDIQLASNFERYLYDLADGNADTVCRWIGQVAQEGGFALESGLMERVREHLAASRATDEETLETIREVHEAHGVVLDPHSAIGVRAALAFADKGQSGGRAPTVAMATAHPAKFSQAIRQAIGHEPPMPPSLEMLVDLPQRTRVLPNDSTALRQVIAETIG